ncbi:MAG: hypothetical protein JWP20_1373 [Roseomonas sp.]|nr:hypothetical protein [Roseomonas sp.]
MDRQIVYEDDQIRTIFQEGSSDFLFITFGDLAMLAQPNESRFYADVPASKRGFSCLGFMAKSPNWFPSQNVQRAVDQLENILTRFPDRVVYGGSMGGYAGIKFSALLRAANVIAFCPQWSIDPAECAGHRNGYERFYVPTMAGMGIQDTDMHGRMHVLYDPAHQVDAFHYRKIAALSPNVVPVSIHMSDHHVTTILAGTSILADVIAACRAGDTSRLYQVTNPARRKGFHRKQILMQRAAAPHPLLTHRLLRNPDLTRNVGSAVADELNFSLAKAFVHRRRPDLADEALARLRGSAAVCPYRLQLAAAAVGECARALILATGEMLRTHHGTVLAYSALDGRLCHVDPADIEAPASGLHPLILVGSGSAPVLGVQLGEGLFAAEIGPREHVTLRYPDAASRSDFVAQFSDVGEALTFQRHGKYFCADPGGGVRYNRIKETAHERFFPFTRTGAKRPNPQ